MHVFFNSYTGLDVYYSSGLYTVFLNSQHIITTWFVMHHHNLVTFKQKFMMYIKAVINTWRNSSTKKQLLEYFCPTCGDSLHLGCLAPASVENNATVCRSLDSYVLASSFPPSLTFLSAWPFCLDCWTVFATRLHYGIGCTIVCKTQVSFIALPSWNVVAFLRTDILTAYLVFEKWVNGPQIFVAIR